MPAENPTFKHFLKRIMSLEEQQKELNAIDTSCEWEYDIGVLKTKVESQQERIDDLEREVKAQEMIIKY